MKALLGLVAVVWTIWLAWVIGNLLVTRWGVSWVEAGALVTLLAMTVLALSGGRER